MDVFIATERSHPGLTASDDRLRESLEARGSRVRAIAWDAIDPAAAGQAVCLRSPWDYHRRVDEFRAWIHRMAASTTPLFNSADTVLWNIDKIYLRELASTGIAIPRTIWSEPGERPDLRRFSPDGRAVIKPRISGGADGQCLVAPGRPLSAGEWRHLEQFGAVLQEYVPEIESRGEVSLVFIDGAFTHAVRKRPRAGDYRVQEEYGGSVESIAPSAPLRAIGERILDAARRPWTYARVDVVETADGPTLMELELIEPDLFMTGDTQAPDRLSDAILRSARVYSATV